jgi:hypothetical protein
MTGQERDYEAILSRVLHTTTDRIEPVGDGLTKIRARLGEPWLKRQWWLLRNEFMVLRWLVVVRCESLFSRIRSRSDLTDLTPDTSAAQEADGGALKSLLSIATSTPAKTPAKRRGRSVGPAMAWFRPALAVAGAVVLVVAGVFALGSIRMVVGLENATGTSTTNSGPGNGNGSANGSGSQFPGSTASQGDSTWPSSGASAGNTKTAPSSTPCAAASPPAQSPPTSPPPTSPPPTSPPPTSPPPTSPPPTSPPPTPPPPSQAPLTGAAPGPTHEAIGTTALVTCEQTPAAPSPSNQAPSGM